MGDVLFSCCLPDPDCDKESFLTSQNGPHILRHLKSNDLINESIEWGISGRYEYGNNASENNRALSG
jgi:hypothetical protein